MQEITYEPAPSLSIPQRDQLMQDLNRDGFVVLPFKLPGWLIDEASQVMDQSVEEARKFEPRQTAFNYTNVVERHPVFRWLMLYTPALQLCYDCFGPQFILNHDQFWVTYRNPENPLSSVGWHSDGPINFPEIDGRSPLHTLRFGYTFSDNTAPDCGALDVIRGSHKKRALHARENLHWEQPKGHREDNFSEDLVQVRGEAGTIYAFHNALWHRALPNRTSQARKLAYYAYTPSWMRSLTRNEPSMYNLQAYKPEERWLLGEPRPSHTWVVGSEQDNKRLARFSRDI